VPGTLHSRVVRPASHGATLAASVNACDADFCDRGIIVITSENFDGEWIARIIERFGYGTALASSSRGGLKALLKLLRDLEAGGPTAFTLDGPRSRARVRPAGRGLAGQGDREPRAAVPHRISRWNRQQLGSHAGTAAVFPRRDRDRRADQLL
jgi:hypothetical protein